MSRAVIVLLAAASLLATGGPARAELEEPISVTGGQITGTPSWGHGVRMYRGVPFAAPPVGERRWAPPQPVESWDGVLAAENFAPACMQRPRPMFTAAHATMISGVSEDCLYLNVWTPAQSADDALPVMVWIYGGGGREGSGAEPLYDPNGLAKKGVVVVTFNYRVNAFGWMAHPELSRQSERGVSGNYGALDQIAALEWVRDNIAAFGGDPDNVTIFGESGGARSVNWLQASPLATGLFHRAIGQSHAVFGQMETLADAEARGETFAEHAGAASLAELRAAPAEQIVETFLSHPTTMNAAVVDGWFLPSDIYTQFATGEHNDVPLITGGNADEGGGASRRGGPPQTLEEYEAFAREAYGEDAEELLAHYPAGDDAEARAAYHALQRDGNLLVHRLWADLHTANADSPAYLYLFSHSTPRWGPDGERVEAGAYHGAEIAYVFDNLRYADRPWNDADRAVADLASDYWVNFARTGDPNGPGLPEWPVWDLETRRLLDIDVDPAAASAPNPAGLDFLETRFLAGR